jgi:hypothetical protein
MAQKVLVQLVDDLDGTASPDISTVSFALDGVSYEIDLTESNADRLREQLADFVGAARRTGGRVKRGTTSARSATARNSDETRKIREWAAEQGFELAGRGRIPRHVTEAYTAAQEADKAAAAAPPKARRGRARATKG